MDKHFFSLQEFDQFKSADIGRCAVIGAAGFVGRYLVECLLGLGFEVVALVNRSSININHPRLQVFQCDVRNAALLQKSLVGVDTVFHTAALIHLFGGKGGWSKYFDLSYDVNVVGTQNIIDACRNNKVARLVYTSSADVCFQGVDFVDFVGAGGQPDYATNPCNVYITTKIEAEKSVLNANTKELATCALRPSGIYGADKNTVLDPYVELSRKGKFQLLLGSADARQDQTYIINLIYAQLLAAKALCDSCDNGSVSGAAGRAYFITDGEALSQVDFLRPVIEGLGFNLPAEWMSQKFAYSLALVLHIAHCWCKFPKPDLTLYAVKKLSQTFEPDMSDAEKGIGYRPLVTTGQALQVCLDYYRGRLSKHA